MKTSTKLEQFKFTLPLPFIFIVPEEKPNPSETFRTYIPDISKAIASCLDEVADKLFAEKLIGQAVLQSTTAEGISNYRKASKVVHELYNQLQAHRHPAQLLTKICDVLLKENDQKLKDIANSIKVLL